ncbi:hypothetical protein AAH978_02815 [Streptomyces sp. ZYX-F-203]
MEAAAGRGAAHVRDSKDTERPALTVDSAALGLVRALRGGLTGVARSGDGCSTRAAGGGRPASPLSGPAPRWSTGLCRPLRR